MKEQKKNSAAVSELNVLPFKTRALPYFIVAPALIITIGIMIPFILAIYYSLTNYSFRLPTYSFVGLKNWIEILSSTDFWKAVWVTLRYAFFSTVIEMGLGMGIAILLNNLNNKFSKIMRVALIFPLMVAPVTATIVWQLMLNNSVGILEKFLNIFGVYNFPWAASPSTAMLTAVMIDVWVNTSFCMLLVLAGLQSLPKSPFESAKIDGGSVLFNFWNLTLPMLKPTIILTLFLCVTTSLRNFELIFNLTGGGPNNATTDLVMYAYTLCFRTSASAGYAMAVSNVLFVVVLIIGLMQQRLLRRDASEL